MAAVEEVFGDRWKAAINSIHNHSLAARLQAFREVIILSKEPAHRRKPAGDKPFIKAISSLIIAQ